jgi:hypothetical protein
MRSVPFSRPSVAFRREIEMTRRTFRLRTLMLAVCIVCVTAACARYFLAAYSQYQRSNDAVTVLLTSGANSDYVGLDGRVEWIAFYRPIDLILLSNSL